MEKILVLECELISVRTRNAIVRNIKKVDKTKIVLSDVIDNIDRLRNKVKGVKTLNEINNLYNYLLKF